MPCGRSPPGCGGERAHRILARADKARSPGDQMVEYVQRMPLGRSAARGILNLKSAQEIARIAAQLCVRTVVGEAQLSPERLPDWVGPLAVMGGMRRR